MAGPTTKQSGNDCERTDSHDNPDIEFETEGNCSNHCELQSRTQNKITMELKITNNSYFTYYFKTECNSSTGKTKVQNDNLPECDDVDPNNSKTYDWEIYRNSGQEGTTDTLGVETSFTKRDVYCPDRTKLSMSLNPKFTYD